MQPATPAQLRYCLALAAKESNRIGFIPRPRFEHDAARGLLRVQQLNGEPCGYVLHGPIVNGRILTIHQAVVQLDARRQQAAADLLDRLVADAIRTGVAEIHLRCRADLEEALLFWRSQGFLAGTPIDTGNARKQLIIPHVLHLPQTGTLF